MGVYEVSNEVKTEGLWWVCYGRIIVDMCASYVYLVHYLVV